MFVVGRLCALVINIRADLQTDQINGVGHQSAFLIDHLGEIAGCGHKTGWRQRLRTLRVPCVVLLMEVTNSFPIVLRINVRPDISADVSNALEYGALLKVGAKLCRKVANVFLEVVEAVPKG